MSPEMFIGFGLSALVVMMLGQSSTPPPSKPKKTVVTFVLPNCDDDKVLLKEVKEASFE